MDLTPFSTPAVWIAVISAIVGLIVKAVRLQGKVDDLADDNKWQGEQIAELKGVVTAHRENAEIHFNHRLSQEVDRRNEQRFVTIERQLGEVLSKLERMMQH